VSRTLVTNKKALFNFDIQDSYEAGLVLEGWEVKSLKNGNGSLDGSYLKEKNGEMFLIGSNVGLWKYGYNLEDQEQDRDRKVLLNKSQIQRLNKSSKEKGFTIVPVKIYENNRNLIKLDVALAKGKKNYDKRKKKKEKDLKRRVEEERKQYNF